MLTPAQREYLADLSRGEGGGVLGNVVVTATLEAATGALGPVSGVVEKLTGAIKATQVPRLSAFAVSSRQRDVLDAPGMAVHRDEGASPRLLACEDFGGLIEQLAAPGRRRPGVKPVDYHRELAGIYGGERFEGREWLFRRIEQALEKKDRGFIVISAGPGVGKTRLALELVDRYRDKGIGSAALGAWHVLRKTEAAWWPAVHLVEQLECRLRERLGCPPESLEKVTEQNAAKILQDALRAPGKRADEDRREVPRFLLVVDGLDEAFGANAPMAGAEQAWLLGQIFPGPQQLPEGVYVLFTTRPGGHLTNWLSRQAVLIDIDKEDEARRENEKDLHDYLEVRLREVANRGGYDPERTRLLVQRMLQGCEGGFYVAQWYARKAAEEPGMFEAWLEDRQPLPRGIDETLRDDWRHKLGTLKSEPSRRLLPVLTGAIAIWHEAGSKVTAEVIEQLFEAGRRSKLDVGEIEASEIKRREVRVCLQKLRDWFDAAADDRSPSYRLRHSRIQELILEELVEVGALREIHALLAWTSGRWEKLNGEPRRVALANAPWHQALAGNLGAPFEKDASRGGAMRLLVNPRNGYLQAVYRELPDAVAVLSRNYAQAIQLAARRQGEQAEGCGGKEPDALMHLRDVWRVLSEYGELMREEACPVGPTLYNHLAAAWDKDSQAHKSIVDAANAHTGPWLERLNPEPPDRRLIAVLRGHSSNVTCLALSPDGTRLASGSADTTLRLWDARTGAPMGGPLTGHTGKITCLAWAPDGKNFASGSSDHTLRLWDGRTGEPAGAPLTGHTGSITCLAWSPDGPRLASGSADTTLRLWDGRTDEPAGALLTGHTETITCLAWSPDGTRLASAAKTTLRFWDARTGALTGEVPTEHPLLIACVVWSPDGTRLATGGWDNSPRLWDTRMAVPVGVPLTGHTGMTYLLAWSPDGKSLATGSDDCALRLWDALSGAPMGGPLIAHRDFITCLAWSPDGTRLTSGSDDNTLCLWDALSGPRVSEPLTGHSDLIDCLAKSPDGTRIATISHDNTVRLWDARTAAPLGEPLIGDTVLSQCLAWSPDGKRLAIGSFDSTVRVWDVGTGTPIGEPLTGDTGLIQCLAWSPDGKRLAIGSSDLTVRLWDARTGASASEPLTRYAETVQCLAWSPDGSQLVSGSREGTLRLWDARTGAPVGGPLTGHTGKITCLAWSPDGTRLASGVGRSIRLLDVQTRASIGAPLTGFERGVICLAWRTDGTQLACCSGDGTLRVRDTFSGSRIACALNSVVGEEVWTSGNDYLVAGQRRGAVHISRYRLRA